MGRVRSEAAKEKSREATRRAKRRRTGICLDCGGVTRYAGKPTGAISARCNKCARRRYAATVKGKGYGPVERKFLAILENGPLRYTEIGELLNMPYNAQSSYLDRLLRYGLIERTSRGLYQLPTKPTP